jgi:hypothetical protein
MASDVKHGKGYTEPKGRPTVHNTGDKTSRRMSSTIEWVLAGIVFIAILGAVFYFGRDFNSGGGGYSGLPTDAPIVQLDEAPVG